MCPRYYQYSYIDGWTSKDESIHLRFGIEYHQALQDYDDAKAEGKGHSASTEYAIQRLLVRTYGWDVDTSERPGDLKNRKSLVMAVVWYLEKYKVDAASTFILDNGKPATELSFKFELDWGPKAEKNYCQSKKSVDGGSGGPQIPCDGVVNENGNFEGGCGEPCEFVMHPETGKRSGAQPYLLCGHLDRVVTYNDELFVMDRKTTTTTLSNYYFSQFEPNNQMTLYSFASKVVLDSPIKGVIIDAVQIMKDGANFQRGITYRTPMQVEEWIGDLQYHLTMAEGYASASYWPMNDTACDKFGGCRFRKICSKDPGVRKQFLKTYFTQLPETERWNPLKPR